MKHTKPADPAAATAADMNMEDAQIATALDRLSVIADEAEIDAKTAVGDVRDCLLDIIKTRPKPWTQMLEGEQNDVVRALEYAANAIVAKVVDAVASAGKDSPVKAILESITEKDGIKLVLKVKTADDDDAEGAILALHRARGKMVLLTKASPQDYSGQRRDPEIDADQRGLMFEAGTDDLDGDADLAGDGE